MEETGRTYQNEIYQVQNALYLLTRDRQNGASVVPDGVYGPETTKAVREFQQENRLPVTGTVDRETWTLLFEKSDQEKQRQAPPMGVEPFLQGPARLLPGDQGSAVGILQLMLGEISKKYGNVSPVVLTQKMDSDTVEQVQRLQEIAGLPKTGIVDNRTWTQITTLYHAAQLSLPVQER